MIAAEQEERAFHVSLGMFSGPLDLLLSLVKEQRLDIATVPLASVASQYLEYVTLSTSFELEPAAEYLSIAATLIFLKSKSLLPPIPPELLPEGEESPQEIEERLRRRLITYSKYRDAAEDFRQRQEDAAAFFYRDAGDSSTELVQRYNLPVERLAASLVAALQSASTKTRTIERHRVSLAAQIDYVLRRVRERGTIAFSELCRGFDRDAVIVTFLAILDLIRHLRLSFQQDGPQDDLYLLRPVEIHG